MKAQFSIKKELNQEKVKDQLKKVLYDSMLKMQEIAKQNCPVDIGTLRNSIILNPSIRGFNKYELVAGVTYAEDVEFGTKPHTVKDIESLKGWARRVLGDENAAYPVQKKIAKKGIEATPYFRPSLYEVKNIWVKRYLNKAFKK